MNIFFAILLGCAIGSTFTLLLLKGSRTATSERPTTAFMRTGYKPLDVSHLEQDVTR